MEKMMRRLVPLLIASLVACETPELRRTRAEADSLRNQVAVLTAELDELKYGAGRLLERARSDLQAGNYKSAIDAAGLLLSKHPESPEAEDARKILAVAERSLAEEEAKRQREKAAKEREERTRRERAVAGLRRKRDDIRGITWYQDRTSPQYVDSESAIFLYIGSPDGGRPFLRLKIQYVASDWLFIESYLIKADSQTFTIAPGHFAIERDNGYGGIWEWYDTPAEARELRIARAIAESKHAVIRYNGSQYYRDRTITAAEKKAIQNVLLAYESLARS